MKQFKKTNLVVIFAAMLLFSSCRLWERVFPPKYGCPTNGANVGAEKLLDQSAKKTKKTKKFKA